MPKTLRILFKETGAELVLDEAVDGFSASVQAGMVNIGSRLGSDAAFPEKGTTLLQSALRGALVDDASIRHACNFAATDTLFFARSTYTASDPDNLAECRLTPAGVSGRTLTVDVYFESNSGANIGFAASL